MSKENITFRLDVEKKDVLDAIATNMKRDRSYVLSEAVEAYIEMHKWQLEEINTAVKEADAEDFASEEEVKATFAKLTNAD